MAVINAEIALKILGNVPEGKQFFSHDGKILSNLVDLSQALTGMTDENFSYHSNPLKTDFSNWVKDVIGDEKLAGDLRKSGNRTRASKNVADRIAFLRSKIPANRRPL